MAHRKIGRSFDFLSSYSYYVPGGKGIAGVLISFAAGTLVASILGALLKIGLGDEFFSIYGELIIYPIMFIPPMLYASAHANKENTGKAIDNDNFAPLGGFLAALLVSFATLLMSLATDPFNALMPPMPAYLKEVLKNITENSPLWVSLLSVSIFAPLFEEWLCRGIILRGLLHRVKPGWAIVISALVFGFIHMNPWQAIPAFLIGCLMGYVYYRTGSLKLTMLMHCVNNTFSVLMSRIDAVSQAESYLEVISDHQIYGLAVVLAILLIFLVIRQLNRIQPLTPQGSFQTLERFGFSDIDK